MIYYKANPQMLRQLSAALKRIEKLLSEDEEEEEEESGEIDPKLLLKMVLPVVLHICCNEDS